MISQHISGRLSGGYYCEGAWVGPYPPSLDVFGSYFPAWLICLLVGVLFAVFVNFAQRVLQIKPFKFLGPLFPVSVILIVSIAVWFLFFSS